MRGWHIKFKSLIKRYGLRFLFCSLGLLLIAGIVADNLPGSRGWFHDLRWDIELKGRRAWAKVTSSDFDPETYPGEGSPQAKELQRKIDEWYPQALERYPRLQVQYKNVPDDQNGFLKIIEWKEESKKADDWPVIPKEIYDLLDSIEEKLDVSTDELPKIETFLNAKQELVERAMAIGLLPDQSIKDIPYKRYMLTSMGFAKVITDHLKLKAILEAGRGDAVSVTQTMRAIRGWGDHYCDIETSNMIHTTFGVAIHLQLQHTAYSLVFLILEEKSIDYNQWAELLKYQHDSKRQWSHMMKGEWHNVVKGMIPQLLPHENFRDPIAFLNAYTSFINDIADPAQISHAGFNFLPPPKGLTAKSRGARELLEYGLTPYGEGYRRGQTVLKQYEVAFTLRKLESEGQKLSSLKEAAIELLPLQVFPDIRLSIDFDKRLVVQPKGKGLISEVNPLAF